MTTEQRLESYTQLLALPDPPDLPRRTHTRTIEGHHDRQRLKAWLPNVYVQHAFVQREDEKLQ